MPATPETLDLDDAYETAWNEWHESGDEHAWNATTLDGLDETHLGCVAITN